MGGYRPPAAHIAQDKLSSRREIEHVQIEGEGQTALYKCMTTHNVAGGDEGGRGGKSILNEKRLL